MAEREYKIEITPENAAPFIVDNMMFDKIRGEFARVKFQIKAHHYTDPNVGDIRIWNLGPEKRKLLDIDFDPSRKEHKTRLKLYAGHKGRVGLLLDGGVFWGRSKKEGVNWVSICQVGQSIDEIQSSYVNEVVTKGTRHSSWLRMLIKKIGNMSAQSQVKAEKIFSAFDSTKIDKGFSGTVEKAMTLIGNPVKLAEQALNEVGATMYVDQTGVNLAWIGETNGEPAVILTPENGLIGTPEEEHYGAKLKCIINPAIRVGSEIDLRSQTLTRLLVSKKMDISGDSHDVQDWGYELSCFNKA
jgi:hypothetical protein